MPPNVRFRRLGHDDLPQLHRWLNEPGVARWWSDDDLSWPGVVAQYGPGIDGDDSTEHWVAAVDGTEVAMLQTYPIADSPAYAAACSSVGADPDAGGLDYLIGEPAWRGRGIGPLLIDRFVEEQVFDAHPAWPQVCSGPDPANRASWRALEKAGFRLLGLIETEEGVERLMARDRTIRR